MNAGKLLSSSFASRLTLSVSLLVHGTVAVVASESRVASAPVSPAAVAEAAIEIEETPLPPPLAEEPPPPAASPAAERVTYTTTLAHPSAPHPRPAPDPAPPQPQTAAAPAAVTATDAPLPRFSIVLGSSNGSGLVSAGSGSGAGTTNPSGSSTGEPEVEAPTVSAPAYLVSSGRPEYPPSARAGGIEADVELEIVVDSHGRVVDSKLLRGAGHGFDESALKAMGAYRFAPAQYHGAPVRVRMHWTVSFRLE